MSTYSKIEWTEMTWNPLTGCTKVSPGCKNCYAERMALRLQAMGQPNYANGFKLALHEHVLEMPLSWKKPRLVFVNSMSDLFHRDVPFGFIDKVFAVMALCPQHTFQQLTKRPEGAVKYYASNPLDRIVALIYNARYEQGTDTTFERAIRDRLRRVDLEDCKAPWSRSETGWGLLQGRENQPVSASQGGVLSAARVPASHGNDQQHESCDGSASAGMDAPQRADTTWTDNQSQEWKQVRQPNREPRVDDLLRTETPCNSGTRRKALELQGSESPQDKTYRGRRTGDSQTSESRDDGEKHCHTVSNEEPGYIRDLQRQDVEAYLTWPLPNVWMGVSVETQDYLYRIDHLRQTNARVKFLSLEPLLGPLLGLDLHNIQWTIVGSESGPGARPMPLEWVTDIRDQCLAAQVPFFMKQICNQNGRKIPFEKWPADLQIREMPQCL